MKMSIDLTGVPYDPYPYQRAGIRRIVRKILTGSGRVLLAD